MTVRGDEERIRIPVVIGTRENRFDAEEQVHCRGEMPALPTTRAEASILALRSDLSNDRSHAQQDCFERANDLSLHER